MKHDSECSENFGTKRPAPLIAMLVIEEEVRCLEKVTVSGTIAAFEVRSMHLLPFIKYLGCTFSESDHRLGLGEFRAVTELTFTMDTTTLRSFRTIMSYFMDFIINQKCPIEEAGIESLSVEDEMQVLYKVQKPKSQC
nr:hypothetical protein HmN_000714200 [Hymenolepis microstoma]